MTDERKHAILLAATLLSARRLIQSGSNKSDIPKAYLVHRAVDQAALILERIDKKWPQA